MARRRKEERRASSASRGMVKHLSLSRLNHGQPRVQAHPEIVQGATEFHDQIADAFFPQADAVFDDATTLDTTIDMLDPQSTLVQRLVRHVLRPRELLPQIEINSTVLGCARPWILAAIFGVSPRAKCS